MKLEQELDLDLPFKDLFHETVLNIVRTAHLLDQIGAELFRRYDLTVAQFNVLVSLKYRERDLTQSDLSRRLVVTRASVTSVLDRLEAKGLVERNKVEGNRRIHHVALTTNGRTLLEEVEPLYFDAIHKTTDGMDQTECLALVTMLEKVRDNIRSRIQGV